MASNIEQSASDLFGAGEIPAERRFFSLAPGGMGAGMTIGDRYNHLLRLQKERADVLSDMAGAQRSELDLMKTTQEMVNIRNRHNVLDELDKLSFRDDDLPDKLAQFDRAQLMDPVVARKVSNLSGKHANYQQANTQIVQSLFDAGVKSYKEFDDNYALAKDMLNNYDTEGLARFFAGANRAKAQQQSKRELESFEAKERIKNKYAGITNFDNLYTTHRKDIRAVVKDAIPSDLVNRFPNQFIHGLPLPETVEIPVSRGTGEKSRDAFAPVGAGEKNEPKIEVNTRDAITRNFIRRSFDSYLGDLQNYINKTGTPDEDNNFTIPVSVEKTDNQGKVVLGKDNKPVMEKREQKVSADTLQGIGITEDSDALEIVNMFAEEAQKRDLKSFIAWGIKENTGLKATLSKIVTKMEDDEPIFDLLLNLVDNNPDEIKPAEAFLTDIYNFVNAIKQFDVITRQNFSGDRGRNLLEFVDTNYLDDPNAPLQNRLMKDVARATNATADSKRETTDKIFAN